MNQGKLSNRFSAPENLCRLNGGPSTDLWALGCIIYEIRAGCHLFPFSIGVSPLDAISEIVQVLGSLPSDLSHITFDDHGFPDPSGEKIVPEQPVGNPLSQVVAEIEVESGVDLERSVTETRHKNLTTSRNYINLDPHHFWIPLPKRGTTLVESLILSHEERAHEINLGKTESSTEDLLDRSRAFVESINQTSAVSSLGAQFSGRLGQAPLVYPSCDVGSL